MSNDNSRGFIGLGNMGEPMCERLLAAGHLVIAFDLDDTGLSFRMDEDWTPPWEVTDQ